MEMTLFFDEGGTITKEGIKNAKSFNLNLSQSSNIDDIARAFFVQFLYQREKIKMHLFDEILDKETKQEWEKLCSCLEENEGRIFKVEGRHPTIQVFYSTHPKQNNRYWRLDTFSRKACDMVGGLLDTVGRYLPMKISLFGRDLPADRLKSGFGKMYNQGGWSLRH